MITYTGLDWRQTLAELGPRFAKRAGEYDDSDDFVAQNYREMREARLFSALVPEELGGGGVPYSDIASMIRELGRCCGSTALTFSMHQHLVAAAVWNYLHGKPGEKLLRAVADGEKVLVSTGATDWVTSNGTLTPCEGGYRFTAKKAFASGCPAGDVLVTSGQLDDGRAGRQVLHFPVPLNAAGVQVDRVWKTMGMRGTGSHTVVLEDVFVPEHAVGLRRPCGEYHPVWNVVITVALPLISAAYVGVAEAAAEKARALISRKGDDGITPALVGEMENELTIARMALDSMVASVNDLDVEPSIEHANGALIRKTLVAEAVRRTAEKAVEAAGGAGYFRVAGLERMLRDAYAAQFHLMPARKQQVFTGRLAMGLDPVGKRAAAARTA